MSTFGGRMREYPLISIDRFDKKNLESTVYFLSHNHTDHTQGLDLDSFKYRLCSNPQYKLYCSAISRDLLMVDERGRYRELKKSIVALEIDEPTTIAIPEPVTGREKEQVTVTLLHAGHCPGSVMMLFEGSEGTVMYTGDFRLTRQEIEGMVGLQSGARCKEIQSLYVDTTFCIPQALYIPSRADATDAVTDIVQEWIAQSPRHMVVIRHKALLGYENLFTQLAQHFNTKVHVSARKYRQYQCVGGMADVTTPDPSSTQIHACHWMQSREGTSALPCGYLPSGTDSVHVRTILVSTMYFTQRVHVQTFAKRFHEKFFRVCYSFHSSYSEVRDLVQYIRPKKAYPNVIPMGETLNQIQSRLDAFVQTAKSCQLQASPAIYRDLGQLKRRHTRRRTLKLSQQSNTSCSLDFGDVGDGTPRKAKKARLEPASTPNKKPATFTALFGGGSPSDLDLSQQSLEQQETKTRLDDDDSEYETDKEDAASAASNEERNYSDDMFSDDNSQEPDESDCRTSLTQADQLVMRDFTPLMQDSYGSFLAYISDDDDCDVISLCGSQEAAQDQQEETSSCATSGNSDPAGPSRGREVHETTTVDGVQESPNHRTHSPDGATSCTRSQERSQPAVHTAEAAQEDLQDADVPGFRGQSNRDSETHPATGGAVVASELARHELAPSQGLELVERDDDDRVCKPECGGVSEDGRQPSDWDEPTSPSLISDRPPKKLGKESITDSHGKEEEHLDVIDISDTEEGEERSDAVAWNARPSVEIVEVSSPEGGLEEQLLLIAKEDDTLEVEKHEMQDAETEPLVTRVDEAQNDDDDCKILTPATVTTPDLTWPERERPSVEIVGVDNNDEKAASVESRSRSGFSAQDAAQCGKGAQAHQAAAKAAGEGEEEEDGEMQQQQQQQQQPDVVIVDEDSGSAVQVLEPSTVEDHMPRDIDSDMVDTDSDATVDYKREATGDGVAAAAAAAVVATGNDDEVIHLSPDVEDLLAHADVEPHSQDSPHTPRNTIDLTAPDGKKETEQEAELLVNSIIREIPDATNAGDIQDLGSAVTHSQHSPQAPKSTIDLTVVDTKKQTEKEAGTALTATSQEVVDDANGNADDTSRKTSTRPEGAGSCCHGDKCESKETTDQGSHGRAGEEHVAFESDSTYEESDYFFDRDYLQTLQDKYQERRGDVILLTDDKKGDGSIQKQAVVSNNNGFPGSRFPSLPNRLGPATYSFSTGVSGSTLGCHINPTRLHSHRPASAAATVAGAMMTTTRTTLESSLSSSTCSETWRQRIPISTLCDTSSLYRHKHKVLKKRKDRYRSQPQSFQDPMSLTRGFCGGAGISYVVPRSYQVATQKKHIKQVGKCPQLQHAMETSSSSTTGFGSSRGRVLAHKYKVSSSSKVHGRGKHDDGGASFRDAGRHPGNSSGCKKAGAEECPLTLGRKGASGKIVDFWSCAKEEKSKEAKPLLPSDHTLQSLDKHCIGAGRADQKNPGDDSGIARNAAKKPLIGSVKREAGFHGMHGNPAKMKPAEKCAQAAITQEKAGENSDSTAENNHKPYKHPESAHQIVQGHSAASKVNARERHGHSSHVSEAAHQRHGHLVYVSDNARKRYGHSTATGESARGRHGRSANREENFVSPTCRKTPSSQRQSSNNLQNLAGVEESSSSDWGPDFLNGTKNT